MKLLLPLLALAAVLGVLYAEHRGQPRYVETHPTFDDTPTWYRVIGSTTHALETFSAQTDA